MKLWKRRERKPHPQVQSILDHMDRIERTSPRMYRTTDGTYWYVPAPPAGWPDDTWPTTGGYPMVRDADGNLTVTEVRTIRVAHP